MVTAASLQSGHQPQKGHPELCSEDKWHVLEWHCLSGSGPDSPLLYTGCKLAEVNGVPPV